MIDLRSDTVTSPSEQMLETVKSSSCKDVFFDIDPSTRALEDRCAEMFGFENAMFTVSGTMSNQVAIKAHTNPGDDVLIDQSYHINYYEAAATSIISNVHLKTIHTIDGIVTPDILEEILKNRTKSVYGNQIKLICLENSINYHCGKVFAFDKLRNLSLFARSRGWKVHLDGARIFNAIAKERVSPNCYGEIVDSMMISLNKALGAPFGSILLGSKDFIKEARIYNKWFGGGLHQSGLLAGMGLYALDNNISRIEDDNNNATILASLIKEAKIKDLRMPNVDTNIVMLDLSKLKLPAIELTNLLATKDIMLHEWSEYILRAVTNLNVSELDVRRSAREIVSAIKVLID